jgi:hypothetical protein
MFLNHARGAGAAFVTALIGTAGLAGCGQAAPSPDRVRQEAAELVLPEPGRYRSETWLVGIDLPGAAPAEARLLRDRMAQVPPQVRTFCLTAAEAAEGFGPMLRHLQQGDCTADRFEASQARISAQLTCAAPFETGARIGIEGTAGPRRSDIDLTIRQTGPDIPGGELRMRLAVQTRWSGRC